jgi:hypothetical protein
VCVDRAAEKEKGRKEGKMIKLFCHRIMGNICIGLNFSICSKMTTLFFLLKKNISNIELIVSL